MENFKGNEKALHATTGLANVSTTGIVLKNLDLVRATERIASAGLQIQQSAIVIGTELLNVKRNKWYKDDFKSFEDYCVTCFGIGKSHRARFMQIADKLANDEGEYPDNIALLSDTVKAEIAAKVSNYKEAEELVDKLGITSDMTVAKVKEILNAHFNPAPKVTTDGDDKSDSKGDDKSDSKGDDKSDSKGDDKSDSKGDDKSDSKGDDKSDSKGDDKSGSKKDSSAEAVSLSMAIADDIVKAVKMAQSPDSISRVYINVSNALFRMLKISNDAWKKAIEERNGEFNDKTADYDPYTAAVVKEGENIETLFGPVGEILEEYGDKVLMYIEQF